jgi:ABC-type nitrate/sulfonate/bicarbonate transport system substrate-binding protein
MRACKPLRKTMTVGLVGGIVLTAAFAVPSQLRAQQEMPEITIATAVSNMAFAALWVAEQLRYFEQEGIRAKITVAGGGSPCQAAVVGRSDTSARPPRKG